ncbi:hypothetical protein BDW62DRAFT_40498 [Aspergillus aurantiobrunneus]
MPAGQLSVLSDGTLRSLWHEPCFKVDGCYEVEKIVCLEEKERMQRGTRTWEYKTARARRKHSQGKRERSNLHISNTDIDTVILIILPSSVPPWLVTGERLTPTFPIKNSRDQASTTSQPILIFRYHQLLHQSRIHPLLLFLPRYTPSDILVLTSTGTPRFASHRFPWSRLFIPRNCRAIVWELTRCNAIIERTGEDMILPSIHLIYK